MPKLVELNKRKTDSAYFCAELIKKYTNQYKERQK